MPTSNCPSSTVPSRQEMFPEHLRNEPALQMCTCQKRYPLGIFLSRAGTYTGRPPRITEPSEPNGVTIGRAIFREYSATRICNFLLKSGIKDEAYNGNCHQHTLWFCNEKERDSSCSHGQARAGCGMRTSSEDNGKTHQEKYCTGGVRKTEYSGFRKFLSR